MYDGIGRFCYVYNFLIKCFVEWRSCEIRKVNVKFYNVDYLCIIKESYVEVKERWNYFIKLGVEGLILFKNFIIWVIFVFLFLVNYIGGGLG